MKKYLFVIKRLPNDGLHVSEHLDLILTCAAFDQSVTLLFIDDGVLQLQAGQQAAVMQLKEQSAIFAALDLYNVTDLYVETESLQQRGLNAAELILDVSCIDRDQLGQFFAQFAVIIPD